MSRVGGFSGATLSPFGKIGASLDSLYAVGSASSASDSPSQGPTTTPGPPPAPGPPPVGLPAVTPPPVVTLPKVPGLFKPVLTGPLAQVFSPGFAESVQATLGRTFGDLAPVKATITKTFGDLGPTQAAAARFTSPFAADFSSFMSSRPSGIFKPRTNGT